jgi:hypothetical protein
MRSGPRDLSDLTDAEFAPMLPAAKRGDGPAHGLESRAQH